MRFLYVRFVEHMVRCLMVSFRTGILNRLAQRHWLQWVVIPFHDEFLFLREDPGLRDLACLRARCQLRVKGGASSIPKGEKENSNKKT